MALHTHTIRKKLKRQISRSDTLDEAIKVMIALATNRASDYGHESVPAATMRACAKDLVEFGLAAEKDLEALEIKENDNTPDSNEEPKYQGVVIKMTAD